ncbi:MULTISPECIES: choice-of-anchor A family protein [unclassified Streptomyces]|uniref:choice-of-anchor A family protein n=1 Tax=unclassified Streptomyces TaxID=2593676 RepID=UPI002E0D12F7|nr:choice-of-anchor A family protein [Streptomyces sp. NBC_01207]WTA18451.1 choice-of-anchor A family protein [Streptomyces sp. NBC_00853]
MSARNWTLGLAIGAVLASAAPAAFAEGPGGDRPTAVVRAPLPGGLGPCVPGDCPDPYPAIGTDGVPQGRDNGVNIFAGGDFRVRGRASEAEGRLVVLGDFDQDKQAGGDSRYNVGIVGAGSRVPPPVGADFLATGGSVTVASGERLLADGGVVRYAGSVEGTVTGRPVRDPAAITPYAGLRDRLSAASQCYARVDGQPRPATGAAVNNGYETLFTGDGSSALQVFNVDANLVGNGGGQQGIRFTRIPATATVLVNVLGATRTISTYSGGIQDTDPLNAYRDRLLWNFPDATTVNLTGGGQFQGSFLMGQQSSETTVTLPGINGRFFTTGSVTHGSSTTGGGGQEFHAYPFNGDLPECGGPAPVTGTVSVLKRDTGTGTALQGAHFELWRETNGTDGLQDTAPRADTLVAECVTPASGICERTTEPGTYYWRETRAPLGYDLDDTVHELTLTAENAAAGVRYEADNRRTPEPPDAARVVLRKTDRATGLPLAGARFDLWRESNGSTGLQTDPTGGDTRLDGACVTDTEGTCTVELPIGHTYYWRETAAPTGYETPADPATRFDLDLGDVADGIVVDVANTPVSEAYEGSIRVVKQDARTKQPLRGAVFELWQETNNTPGLQTRGTNADRRVAPGCTTDRTGVCTFGPLPEGWYYLVETAVPAGYVLPPDRVTGPLRLDIGTPDQRIVVTLRNKPVDHGKDDHGKGDQGKDKHPKHPKGDHGKGKHPQQPKHPKGDHGKGKHSKHPQHSKNPKHPKNPKHSKHSKHSKGPRA